MESFLVYRKTFFTGNFTSEIQRESVGIVQLKGIFAGKCFASCRLGFTNQFLQNGKSGVNGSFKPFFFHCNNFLYIALFFRKFRICSAAFTDCHKAKLAEKSALDSDAFTVACGAAQQAAEHIASAFVGGNDSVCNHKGCAAYVVGNYTN